MVEFEKVVLLARRSAAERNKIARRFEEEMNKIARSSGEERNKIDRTVASLCLDQLCRGVLWLL